MEEIFMEFCSGLGGLSNIATQLPTRFHQTLYGLPSPSCITLPSLPLLIVYIISLAMPFLSRLTHTQDVRTVRHAIKVRPERATMRQELYCKLCGQL